MSDPDDSSPRSADAIARADGQRETDAQLVRTGTRDIATPPATSERPDGTEFGVTVLGPAEVGSWKVAGERSATVAQLGRMQTLIDMVKSQADEERGLRRWTAVGFMVLFAAEIVAIFVAFYLLGAEHLKFEKWSAEAFLGLALLQSATLLGYIVKYLFPDRVNDLVRIIEAELRSSRANLEVGQPLQSPPPKDESR